MTAAGLLSIIGWCTYAAICLLLLRALLQDAYVTVSEARSYWLANKCAPRQQPSAAAASREKRP